tara:strand:+ start:3713 stop:5479 length:1767 start_codon:yes stop_codon:yes gene_type:complete
MANYTQPSRTLPSTSSAYIDEAGRQIAMSIYNPLYKGSKRDYISYSSMGVTASLAISASERTPTSSIVFYSGSNQVFLLSASAAFTAGINLEVGYTLSDPSVTFRSTTYTSSDAIGDVEREYDRREQEYLEEDERVEKLIEDVATSTKRQTSRVVFTKNLEGPLRITTGSSGTTRTGSLRIKQGASLRIVDGINFTIYGGCTDPTSLNYNPYATLDNNSCRYPVYGCTDPNAYNYNPGASVDDGSCGYLGCTDPAAINYNPQATINNGACHYAPIGGEVPRQNYFITDNNKTDYIQPIDRTLVSEVRPQIVIKPNRPNPGNSLNIPSARKKLSKGQKFVLNTTGAVYKGAYYTFNNNNLKNSTVLKGKRVKGNAPLLIPTEFQASALLSSRNGDRVYADTNQAISSNLPLAYGLPTNGGQNCMGCAFYKNNNCSKWNAQVRQQYYCAAWLPPELLIPAGDIFRLEYPGITQTGFYTKGNEFLLPHQMVRGAKQRYYVGHYHILPDGAYKTDNSSTIPFGTALTLKQSLKLGPNVHFTKITLSSLQQQLTITTQTTQTTTTSPTTISSTQTTTQPVSNNTSGTGTSYSY